jgi:endo-1,4-beta-xylanase
MRTSILLVMIAGCATPAQGPTGQPQPSATAAATGAPTLRQAAEQVGRRIGTACETSHLEDPRFKALAAQQFDSLTPENQMKWEAIEPQPGTFSFRGGDQLAAFAAESGMRLRGHTLVWHSQLAPWVKELSGEALRAAMIRHVKGVAGHFKGKVAQWDVVNEAIADGPGGELRADSPFTALGPTFLDDAFRAAHEAAPDAQLFYNDYEIEGEGVPKTEGAYRQIKRLKDAGVPIHGVGFQMHVDPRHWPPIETIRSNFERFAALGLAVEITEMDVPVGELPGSLEQKLAAQKVIAHDIVAACVAVPKCTGITFWGFTDKHTWLNSPQWGKLRGRLPHLPLPFDDEYRPKPMVAGVIDAFAGR